MGSLRHCWRQSIGVTRNLQSSFIHIYCVGDKAVTTSFWSPVVEFALNVKRTNQIAKLAWVVTIPVTQRNVACCVSAGIRFHFTGLYTEINVTIVELKTTVKLNLGNRGFLISLVHVEHG